MIGMHQVQPGQVAFGLNLQQYKVGGPMMQEPTIYSFSQPQSLTPQFVPGTGIVPQELLSPRPRQQAAEYQGPARIREAPDASFGGGYGRGRLIESYIASAPAAPVESFLAPPVPETPTMPMEFSTPSYEAPMQTMGGSTFMSAMIDASRSPSAAEAISRHRISGESTVRGIGSTNYRAL